MPVERTWRLRANTEFTATRNAMQVYEVYNRVLNGMDS